MLGLTIKVVFHIYVVQLYFGHKDYCFPVCRCICCRQLRPMSHALRAKLH